MIGKYTYEDFFNKLTTDEQRTYLLSLVETMTNKQAKELLFKVNDARAIEIQKHLDNKDYDQTDMLSHFF